MKKLVLLVSLIFVMLCSCTKVDNNYFYDDGDTTIVNNEMREMSVDYTFLNTITDFENVIDGDLNTYGYLTMDVYSNHYYGELYIDLGSEQVVSSFTLKYSFPNVSAGNSCHGFPDPIHYEAEAILYMLNNNNQWVEISNPFNLPVEGNECEVINTINIETSTIQGIHPTVRKVKIQLHGLYWLGGVYEQTRYYKAFELSFN